MSTSHTQKIEIVCHARYDEPVKEKTIADGKKSFENFLSLVRHMIAWIYSVAGFATLLTAGGQKVLEGAKRSWSLPTASGSLLALCMMILCNGRDPWVSSKSSRALRRLVAPPRAAKFANTGIQQGDMSPFTKSQNPMVKSLKTKFWES